MARASVANEMYARFFGAMLERGVALAPGPYEAMFPGLAHTDDVLDTVVAIAADAAAAIASAVPP
jgi:glutamate-1-semialdehyde 2,1-aminomutase